VAFEDAFCDDKAGTCFGDVLRYDGARDRFEVLYDWEDLAPASKVVVTPEGAVAWLRRGEVRTADRVLAGGASSLAVAGRRLYWSSGGRASSTLLGPPSQRQPAPRSIRSRDCAARGQTVVANRFVRVFRINHPVVGSRVYHVCDLRRHRSRLLDRDDDGDGLQRVALAGRRVAYEYAVCDDPESGGCEHGMYRSDIRRRRPALVTRVAADADMATDLVITRTGAMAWIVGVLATGRQLVADGAGVRTLETGDALEAGSLAVAGRRVYWTSGGEARSALLD
jgi:hypothetical protein